jgi:hypothetical protein
MADTAHRAVFTPVTACDNARTPPTMAMLGERSRPPMSATTHDTHASHDHEHGDDCGHVAVAHGDHVDYLHDGHVHRLHDDHWDECVLDVHVVHDGHDHAHGEGCGHEAVAHGDHVDYLHDGHRHAAHGDHWDEH